MIRAIVTLLLLLPACGSACAQTGVYWIGNSLTWDTIPSQQPGTAAGTNEYHVDCGVSLAYIYANPDAPCVGTSTIWPTALAARQFAVLSMQPHPVESFDSVVATIETWMDLQPSALVVIHSAWAPHADIDTEWDNPTTATVTRSATFIDALLARLRSDYPTRKIVCTYTHAMIHDIKQDCDAETAPFATVDYLYRDDLHMTGGSPNDGAGRYLMHNAVRRTLELPYAEYDLCTASAEIKAYLRGKIEAYHPTAPIMGSFQ